MQGFILALLTCSVTMSAIALLLIIAEPFLTERKRFYAKSRYYTWVIIIVGLIIPFRPHFGGAALKISLPAETALSAVPINADAPNSVQKLEAMGLMAEDVSVGPQRKMSLWRILASAWAIGAFVFLAYQAARHLRFLKSSRRWSEPIEKGEVYELLLKLKENAGIKGKVGLFLCQCVNSPMATGIVNRRILLPHTGFDAEELPYVLTHELVHLKRKDLCYRLLTLTATAIHWFNPVVYMAGHAIDMLCEMSCDEEVLSGLDADARLFYTKIIIGAAKNRSGLKTALSTGFNGDKKDMKKRISSIMDMNKKRTGAALICAALIMSLGMGFTFTAETVSAASAVTRELTDILLGIESPGTWITHNPQEGQISREEAVSIAEESVPRLLRHFHVEDIEDVINVSVSEAYLRKATAASGHDLDLSAYAPKFSFWVVALSSPDGLTGAKFLIQATSGIVLSAEIYGYPVTSDAWVSAEKALYGFAADLGFEAVLYDKSGQIAAGDLDNITVSCGLPPDYSLRAVSKVSGEPYIRKGQEVEGMTQVRLQLYLTTRI
jgi:beta-lactamase regulating signal transducer with metallopeptidase domain